MADEELVSVVVPLFNKAPFIRRALDSIIGQTFSNLEILVIDDGSTDESAEMVRRCDDSRITLIQQQNAGPGAARNRGISQARGKLIAFLDADDEWLPDFIERATRSLLNPGSQVSAFTRSYYIHPGARSSETMWRGRGLQSGMQQIRLDMKPELLAYMLAFMSPCTTVARAETIRRLGGFYGEGCRFGEDSFLWLKVLLNEQVEFDLSPGARFHNDASGLSRNLGRVRATEPFLIHPELIEACCPSELKPLLARLFAFRAFKTACVLGYWGQWREAAALRKRFRVTDGWKLGYFIPSAIAATRYGAAAGSTWRVGKRIFRSLP